MYKVHKSFHAPEDIHQKIWRYVDFTKYVSLLDQESLFFSRGDLLGDPFEGSISNATVSAREEYYRKMCEDEGFPENVFQYLIETSPQLARDSRKWVFVNCWNMSDYESPVLWSMYANGNKGIAIRSTFDRLVQSLKESDEVVHIGLVNYVDYDRDYIPAGNFFYPFLHKRKGFEHENELRAIVMNIPTVTIKTMKSKVVEIPKGITVHIDRDTLIDKIYIAPTAPEWFGDLVGSVSQKYGFINEILRSKLANPPVF